MLGVDVLDVTDDARDFIEEYGLTYPMLRDKDGSGTRASFGVVAYPETFVIDTRGQITAVAARAGGRGSSCAAEVEPLL